MSKIVNFFKGHPTEDLLPAREILQASQSVLQKVIGEPNAWDDVNRHPLTYGADPGNLDTRKVVAEWIDRLFSHTIPTNPECINMTAGASYGIMNILAQTTSPHNGVTRRAFITSPTYFLINGTFIDMGFSGKLTAIEEYSSGDIDLVGLEKQLKHYDSIQPVPTTVTKDHISQIHDPKRDLKKIYRYVVYLTPTYSNPRGGTVSLECRKRLIELARKYDMLIICDDVYDLLSYESGARFLPRFVHLDRATAVNEYGNTISNGSFSKLLGAGLRVGWQETVSPKMSLTLASGGANRSGGTPSQFNSILVEELIKSGAIDEIVRDLIKVYAERVDVFRESTREHLPEGTQIDGGQGGYFLWVTLPEGYDMKAIVAECKTRGVILAGGENFEVEGDSKDWGDRSCRCSISYLTSEQIKAGIAVWGEVCKKFQRS
ncbi:unnamed protein product [Kuraishia capsulata CBS 1993]|uniref:Aminotransferase class I/classII large domain-containing protein n=1 Tax=Kuraishia capsulata CBS 1993 TaxID=1382522 RepID=W6MPC1_9ASCO|nr:uncharacterized protein KUCA_T00002934001 [Kuraishia capsulata CBS 1993]CDK26957.1 unnamed protein product [Kuraishia capsulata CBS 1993]